VVLITHQMQVIKQVADRVAVLDAGRVVEQGEVVQVFTHPREAVTRGLVEDVVPQKLPESVVARIRGLMAEDSTPGELLRLAFAGDRSDQPLLSDLVRRFGLDLNIVHGQVDEIQGRPFGSLAVLARGARGSIVAAVDHLRLSGVRVEVAHV
jgi:D-methionine transport system ATP-binding protein